KLIPGLDLKTAAVSNFSGQGTHTTTFAEMFELPGGGYLIDTPGIREFGIYDISREELSHYFVEMRARFNQCRFDNCRHINEPCWVVYKPLDSDELARGRYDSYLSMFEGFDTRA